MTDLVTIAKLPDVKGAVLGDLGGGYLDAVGEQDGETIAAVTGFVATSLAQAGEELGLGALHRVSVAGAAAACVIVVDDELAITGRIAPAKALAAVEKALDAALAEEA